MPPPYSHADTSGNTASLWAAGLKGLTDVLTAREVARLDAADRAALESNRAEQRQERARALDLQERQVNAQIEDRKARTEADIASKAEEAQIKQRIAAMQIAYATSPSPVLAAQIKDLGGNVPEGKPREKATLHTDGAGVVWDLTDPSNPKKVLQGGHAPKEPKEPKAMTPKLQTFLDQFPTSGRPIEEAYAALSRAWPQFQKEQAAAGVPTNLKEAADYLRSIYVKDPLTQGLNPLTPPVEAAPIVARPGATVTPPAFTGAVPMQADPGAMSTVPPSASQVPTIPAPPRPPGVPPSAVWDPTTRTWIGTE